jgi:hypothetical protein
VDGVVPPLIETEKPIPPKARRGFETLDAPAPPAAPPAGGDDDEPATRRET